MLRQARVVFTLIVGIVALMLPIFTQSLFAQTTTSVTTQSGFPKSEPYGSFFAAPTVVDFNRDGKLDVLAADSTGCIWGFDRTGAMLPSFPWKTGGVCDNEPRINSPLAVADIDGDGQLEVVAGTRGKSATVGQLGKVFVYRNNGTIMSGWPREMAWANITNGNNPEVMTVALANITGDAKLEVIAGTSNEAGSNTNYAPNVYAWTSNGTIVSGFPTTSPKGSGIFGQISAADINGDGYDEILVGRDEIYFYAYNGQGQNLPGWPLHTYLDDAKRTWGKDLFMEFTRSAPAAADLDGDGTMEVILAGKVRDPNQAYKNTSSAVLVVQSDGKRRAGWSVGKTVGAPLQTTFTPNTQVAIADLNGDGKLEIVVTFDDGTIRAYSENGTQLWSYNYTSGQKLFASEVAIGDVTGDGKLDIVFGTYSFDATANSYVRVHALNTAGQPQAPFPLTPTSEGTGTAAKGFMAGLSLADLDGNGTVDIVGHSRGGVLYAWNTNVAYNASKMPWPTARQNNLRNGWYKRTSTVVQPTATTAPPTATVVAPTATVVAPTATVVAPTSTPVTSGPSIAKLTLINADTNAPMAGYDPLLNNTTLTLSALPTRNLNIRAHTNPATVGSVKFVLNGATFRIENMAPYALAGDGNNGTDYYAWTPTVGTHTLTVTPYSGSSASGTAGMPYTITFVVQETSGSVPTATVVAPTSTPVTSGPSIAKLTLINADTNAPMAGYDPLLNNTTLTLSALPTRNLNIRAHTNPATVGSVKFVLNGATFRIENMAPYALAGDGNNGTDYYAWTPTVGTHTLTVTPYSGSSASGTAGTPYTITLIVK